MSKFRTVTCPGCGKVWESPWHKTCAECFRVKRSRAGKLSGRVRNGGAVAGTDADEDKLLRRYAPTQDRRLSNDEIARMIERADRKTWNLIPPWKQQP